MIYVLRGDKLIPKELAAPLSGAYFLPDIVPFVTQDGKEITSRSRLREYEQKNGVKQVGNDFAAFHRELRHKVRGID
jgi:hypothetical protein